jgi:hypothetical protein
VQPLDSGVIVDPADAKRDADGVNVACREPRSERGAPQLGAQVRGTLVARGSLLPACGSATSSAMSVHCVPSSGPQAGGKEMNSGGQREGPLFMLQGARALMPIAPYADL